MGIYLKRGNEEFASVINSQIYIDKTDILSFFNEVINTEQRYVCVSRPRRFGKSITANTIAAYFEKGCDSRLLFEGRKLMQRCRSGISTYCEDYLKEIAQRNLLSWHISQEFFQSKSTIANLHSTTSMSIP